MFTKYIAAIALTLQAYAAYATESPQQAPQHAHQVPGAGTSSEQVYWVFTVSVDKMENFAALVPKLVAATAKEPGALQFEFNIGADRRTVDIFERYTDSKAALLHQTQSFGPLSKEFFAVAKLKRWVVYGAPTNEFQKANAAFHPIYMKRSDGFVR